MTVRVGAVVPPHSIPIASALLGIRGASQAGVIRAALALFQGKTPLEAGKYAASQQSNSSWVTANVPDELAPETDKSWAIRVGLGLAAGMERDEAEAWARMRPGPKPKDKNLTTG